jgi:hypothetical protein
VRPITYRRVLFVVYLQDHLVPLLLHPPLAYPQLPLLPVPLNPRPRRHPLQRPRRQRPPLSMKLLLEGRFTP